MVHTCASSTENMLSVAVGSHRLVIKAVGDDGLDVRRDARRILEARGRMKRERRDQYKARRCCAMFV